MPRYIPRAPYSERCIDRHRTLDRAVKRLCEIADDLGGVEAIYVFGSYARGEVRPNSDLDALIVRATTEPHAQRDLPFRRALDVPVGLDLLIVTPEEFANQLPSTSFGRTILATARRVDAA